MPGRHATSLSRKGGTARDGSVMVPLAWVMLMAIAGLLMMPVKGTWLLSTVPPSIKVRKATLLLVQVKSHAAATLLPRNTNLCLLKHFLFCLFCWWTGTVAKHKTRSCLMYEWLTLAKGMMNEPTGWLAAVAVQATEGGVCVCVCLCVCVCVCQSFWSGRMINERERGREREKGEGVRGKRDREG